MNEKILIVDDDKSHRQMLNAVLNDAGYSVKQAENGLKAIELVESETFDLVLLDIRMEGLDGISALKEIKDRYPNLAVIMMTAYSSVSTAVNALKSGAYDYLTKPLDIEELKLLVKKALSHRRLEMENRLLKERLDNRYGYDRIIGTSPAMQKLFETISLVSPTDATVLLLGESGTGKEMIANAIHQNSDRKDKPFIKVNCAALPETLLESELFGHEKGAFTGATASKQGRFQLAHKGSIFLDEIGEMAPMTQAKILRVLQEREFEPIGGARTVKIDTRVIAATNIDLEEAIQAGRFREDLYYRLNVVTVQIPPLKDRKEDILLLANFFLDRFNKKNQRMLKGFAPKVKELFMNYAWPGNVRELENTIERAVILSRDDVITPDDLPDAFDPPSRPPDGRPAPLSEPRTLKDVEREMILRTLEETSGNRTHAAKILGVSRRTLQLKLKDYDISNL